MNQELFQKKPYPANDFPLQEFTEFQIYSAKNN
jgi:hypothetical protein